MVDVLLNTEDVVVLGPPETIDVLVDIGPQGTRGSKIIVGSSEPNALTTNGVIFGQTLVLNDLYINASPGPNYGYMFQYISSPGGNSWTEILRISPAIYSSIQTTQFTAGFASLTIPITTIVSGIGSPLEAFNFNIQYQISGTNPISSSFQVQPISETGTNLIITFNAVEYADDSWTPLLGEKDIHLFISIIQ
jgi:hypothetical protein